MTHKLIKTEKYLLVVDDSVNPYDSSKVGNPIAHLPLNGSPILHGVDLLPPYHQEDSIEVICKQEAEKLHDKNRHEDWGIYNELVSDDTALIKIGYNKAREKYKLTLSKLIDLYVNETGYGMDMWSKEEDETMSTIAKIIQSLHQYPTEFECDMEYYYHSSPKYYHDAGFVKCDETQYNIIRKTIPECDTKIEPKTITTIKGTQWVGKYK